MHPCRYCGKDFEAKSVGGHIRWCKDNPEREKALEALEKSRQVRAEMLADPEQARSKRPCGNQFTTNPNYKFSPETKAKIAASSRGRTHTEEAKKKVSEARIKWLQDNPDKHPWRSKGKFLSVPCEHLKKCLREEGLPFEEEYQPFPERFFSLDIAFPDKKIAVEVNGNQHYEIVPNSTCPGLLKTYYLNRHRLLVAEGWTVLEVHYPEAFKEETLGRIRSLFFSRV
jgi:hypothetical protein